jgi:16S rRNA (cytosine967-C5)-methyltransferase
MIFDNQLRLFNSFLEEYKEDKPLAKFFPEFFKRNKQMGSRDRKFFSQLVYNYFRLGKALLNEPVERRLFVALFLCNQSSISFLNYFDASLDEKITLPVEEKLKVISEKYPDFRVEDVFPFEEYFSTEIDKEKFIISQFTQPKLFLRAANGKADMLKAFFNSQQISFQSEGNCFELANTTSVDSLEYLFEIQDRSSQQTGQYFEPKPGEYWWDCCAASGGKSLMLHDMEPSVKLFVSDVRESVLNNLSERFERAGIKKYTRRVIELLGEIESIEHNTFDGIILDAPCSGSGTWGRTPEMISQFEIHKIDFFSQLQKDISDNVIQFLKPGKPLIYITCSVFKKENEEIVDFLVNEKGMKLEKMELIRGYENQADTMFAARLLKT